MVSGTDLLRKILYVGMRYDYGKPERGTSFEYNTFFKTLERMVPQVVEFDFMTLMQQHGKEDMNRMLIETAQRELPDLIFFILFTDEVTQAAIARLTERFVTFNWFCDDHWRFSNYSKHYAPVFSFVSTTDSSAIPKYERIGYRHALLTQWACNHFDYVKLPNTTKEFDVTFIGQPHGNRKHIINDLARKGIPVQTFGQGWDNGRISQERMIEIFNTTKVNLNLSNSSWNIHSLFRGRQQIKGRNFEIPGTGGFLLTNYVEGIDRFYEIDKEIVCFRTLRELRDRIYYFLEHDDEREAVAQRGYERTLRDHTYELRFRQLFSSMGFGA